MIWDGWTFVIGLGAGFLFYVLTFGTAIKVMMKMTGACPTCKRPFEHHLEQKPF